MSDTSNILSPKRRDTRWPVMPAPNNMLPMPSQPRPSGREHFRPRNGPPIEEWEAALIGRQLIKEDTADMVSDKSLHATLKICSQKAHGALSRLPIEVILSIEHLLHSSVSESYHLRRKSEQTANYGILDICSLCRLSKGPTCQRISGFRLINSP